MTKSTKARRKAATSSSTVTLPWGLLGGGSRLLAGAAAGGGAGYLGTFHDDEEAAKAVNAEIKRRGLEHCCRLNPVGPDGRVIPKVAGEKRSLGRVYHRLGADAATSSAAGRRARDAAAASRCNQGDRRQPRPGKETDRGVGIVTGRRRR